jgi:hypothetical protein
MRKLTNCARKLDLFKYYAAPRHIGGAQSSKWGFIGTIIFAAVVVFYGVFSLVRFLNDPPQTSVVQNPTGESQVSMVKTCISVPHLADTRYFGYTFQRNDMDNNSRASAKVDINVTVVDNNTICLPADSTDGYLNNYCKLGQACSFLKFKLWFCGTPDSKNPARNTATNVCAPFDDQVNIVQNNYVTFLYYTHLGDVLHNTAPKANASAQYFAIFQLNETRTNPDLLRWFNLISDVKLQHDSNTFSIQYYFGERPYKEILELNMILGAEAVVTVQNRQTSLDLIGQIGALVNVIFAILSLAFLKYNQWCFYEANPKWNHITADFTVQSEKDWQEADFDPFDGMSALISKANAALGGETSATSKANFSLHNQDDSSEMQTQVDSTGI